MRQKEVKELSIDELNEKLISFNNELSSIISRIIESHNTASFKYLSIPVFMNIKIFTKPMSCSVV